MCEIFSTKSHTSHVSQSSLILGAYRYKLIKNDEQKTTKQAHHCSSCCCPYHHQQQQLMLFDSADCSRKQNQSRKIKKNQEKSRKKKKKKEKKRKYNNWVKQMKKFDRKNMKIGFFYFYQYSTGTIFIILGGRIIRFDFL